MSSSAEERAECVCSDGDELVFGLGGGVWIAGAANEDADEAMVWGNLVGKDGVGPEGAHDGEVGLVVGHEEAEPIEGVLDVGGAVSQIEDDEGGALDGVDD